MYRMLQRGRVNHSLSAAMHVTDKAANEYRATQSWIARM